MDSYCTSGRFLMNTKSLSVLNANPAQCQNSTNFKEFSRKILRRWPRCPHIIKGLVFANLIDRTVDPFLCIISSGESIVSPNSLLGIRLALRGRPYSHLLTIPFVTLRQRAISTEVADLDRLVMEAAYV